MSSVANSNYSIESEWRRSLNGDQWLADNNRKFTDNFV